MGSVVQSSDSEHPGISRFVHRIAGVMKDKPLLTDLLNADPDIANELDLVLQCVGSGKPQDAEVLDLIALHAVLEASLTVVKLAMAAAARRKVVVLL